MWNTAAHGNATCSSPMKPALIVFDLDGTLVDTNRDLIPALNHAIAAEDVPPVGLAEVGHVVGQGARRMIERAFELRGRTVPRERMDALHQQFLAHYEAHIADLSRPYAGLEAALDALTAEGHAFAVCTNKSERLARLLLEALGMTERFPTVAGGDTFPVRKPDPAHIRLTVERAGFDPADAFMVGDSVNDIAAARALPVPVVAVDFGYTDVPVRELGPDRVISHYRDLPAALQALDRRA